MPLGALFFRSPGIRRTAIVTTTAPIHDPPVEACLAQLLDHLGIPGAHFAGRSLADVQDFIAKYPERIASLTLVCPTVLNPRCLVPLGAKLMVVTGDHGLGARRVQAVLPDLPETTAVVLNDYAGLTWADLAADRRDHIDAAIREFHQRCDAPPANGNPWSRHSQRAAARSPSAGRCSAASPASKSAAARAIWRWCGGCSTRWRSNRARA